MSWVCKFRSLFILNGHYRKKIYRPSPSMEQILLYLNSESSPQNTTEKCFFNNKPAITYWRVKPPSAFSASQLYLKCQEIFLIYRNVFLEITNHE